MSNTEDMSHYDDHQKHDFEDAPTDDFDGTRTPFVWIAGVILWGFTALYILAIVVSVLDHEFFILKNIGYKPKDPIRALLFLPILFFANYAVLRSLRNRRNPKN